MPYIYRPHEGAWLRFYYPTGSDIAAVCAARGWLLEPPEGVQVVDAEGTVMQEATVEEPVVEKPAKHDKGASA